MTPHALETKAVVSVFVCLCVWCRAQSWTRNHRQGRGECLSHRGPQLWAGFWNIQPLLLSAIVFVVIGDLSICFPALDLPNGACVSHALKQHDQSVIRTQPVPYVVWMLKCYCQYKACDFYPQCVRFFVWKRSHWCGNQVLLLNYL